MTNVLVIPWAYEECNLVQFFQEYMFVCLYMLIRQFGRIRFIIVHTCLTLYSSRFSGHGMWVFSQCWSIVQHSDQDFRTTSSSSDMWYALERRMDTDLWFFIFHLTISCNFMLRICSTIHYRWGGNRRWGGTQITSTPHHSTHGSLNKSIWSSGSELWLIAKLTSSRQFS